MNFEDIIGKVLEREGGFVDHPTDRGGATNFGVTQRVYDTWRVRQGLPVRTVRNIARDEAVGIYREQYWDAAKCEQLASVLRDIHFDAAVNHGVRRAAMLLQTACGVKEDGQIGPKTLQAASSNPPLVLARYVVARYRFYGQIVQRDRSQLVFIVGWLRRMEEFSVFS